MLPCLSVSYREQYDAGERVDVLDHRIIMIPQQEPSLKQKELRQVFDTRADV